MTMSKELALLSSLRYLLPTTIDLLYIFKKSRNNNKVPLVFSFHVVRKYAEVCMHFPHK